MPKTAQRQLVILFHSGCSAGDRSSGGREGTPHFFFLCLTSYSAKAWTVATSWCVCSSLQLYLGHAHECSLAPSTVSLFRCLSMCAVFSHAALPVEDAHTHAHACFLIWHYAFKYHLSRTHSHPSILPLTSLEIR